MIQPVFADTGRLRSETYRPTESYYDEYGSALLAPQVMADVNDASQTAPQQSAGKSNAVRIVKWVAFVAAVIFFFAVVRQAVDPFGDQPFIEVTHGDHTHYVPKDRDPNVPVGQFPTREPGPNEHITPEGRIVEK